MTASWFRLSSEVALARTQRHPVVALESTLITHGLPWPDNFRVAQAAQQAVRAEHAIPATIGIIEGLAIVGMSDAQTEQLAQNRTAAKASQRDIAAILTQKRTAGTTVAATLALARQAGIVVFATGGIGGVHPRQAWSDPWDISADLMALARTPMLVVCAGAKNILDLPQTLECLDSLAIPVIGYRTDAVPLFASQGSGGAVSCRFETATEIAQFFQIHQTVGGGGGVLVMQPLPEELALAGEESEVARTEALRQAQIAGIRGPELTPYLLARIAEQTQGRSIRANEALIVANARLAAQLSVELERLGGWDLPELPLQ
jgi:pseudouridine-5'-phosphate glycosidase